MIKIGDFRGIVEAVNEACECGGGGPSDCCPACEVFHAIKGMEFPEVHAKPAPAPNADRATRVFRELPPVGSPVEVVPEVVKAAGTPWFRTVVSKRVNLYAPQGYSGCTTGFEVHGRIGLFLPCDEEGEGNIQTWRRVVTTERVEPAKGGR
jgi:hypothetical protein